MASAGNRHDHYPTGTPVITADGHAIGTLRAAYPHFVLVAEADGEHDLEVPGHAIDRLDDGTLHLSVNREALSELRDAAAFSRTHPDGG